MNKDNKFENTVGIDSTYPKDMPKDHGEIPVWNSKMVLARCNCWS